MKIARSDRFKRDWSELSETIKSRAEKQLKIFFQNPRHPSLRIGKLGGTDIFYGRITRGYRFTFVIEGDTYILRRIGPHDIIKTP